MDTGKAFRSLTAHLTARGAQCLTPSLEPSDGRQGLEDLARKLYSFWTPLDLVIIPPTSSVWPRAENIRLLAPCHPCMLWSRELKGHIATRMGLIQPGPDSPRLP